MNKFDLLFEEIMKQTINSNTFDFDFVKQENGSITCNFNAASKNNKIVPIEITMENNGIQKIVNTETGAELSEKEFMVKYYKDYENFLAALDNFKEGNINNKKISVTEGDIIPFTQKLADLETKNDGIEVKSNNITFNFRPVEENIPNLFQANFNLVNNFPEHEELNEYKVISLIKILKKNSIPLKFILQDPNSESEIEDTEQTVSTFKERWPDYYKALLGAIDEYERIQE
jgi:hypothetical protein